MYIWSDGIYIITYHPNTITYQSTDISDTPRDPIYGPVTWNPSHKRPDLCYIYIYSLGKSAIITITSSTTTASISFSGTRHLSYTSTVIGIRNFCASLFQHSWFDLDYRHQFKSDLPVWFNLCWTKMFFIWVTAYSYPRESHTVHIVQKTIQQWNRGILQDSENEIGFGKRHSEFAKN